MDIRNVRILTLCLLGQMLPMSACSESLGEGEGEGEGQSEGEGEGAGPNEGEGEGGGETCELPPGFVTDEGLCAPPHRVTAESCDAAPPVACSPEDNDAPGPCDEDSDCPNDGACVDYYEACYCSVPTCLSDNDCDPGFACGCGGYLFLDRNACFEADCSTDADCGIERCVYVPTEEFSCDFNVGYRFLCTSAEDECESDTDCEEPESCMFNEEAGHLVCAQVGGTCD